MLLITPRYFGNRKVGGGGRFCLPPVHLGTVAQRGARCRKQNSKYWTISWPSVVAQHTLDGPVYPGHILCQGCTLCQATVPWS